jgi:hypothetical protein
MGIWKSPLHGVHSILTLLKAIATIVDKPAMNIEAVEIFMSEPYFQSCGQTAARGSRIENAEDLQLSSPCLPSFWKSVLLCSSVRARYQSANPDARRFSSVGSKYR